jgi:hypothetical protein
MEDGAVTADERDELVADLLRICVLIEKVEPRPDYPGEWQIVAWSPNPLHRYTITNAKVFREAVHAGLNPDLPRGALD